MRSSLSSASLGRNLVERNILVDADIAGQTQHAFGDDVAHDFVGAAFDPGSGRAQQHRLKFSRGFGIFGAAQYAGRALQVQRISRDILKDRKSTRLNSSHVSISYAVFCLKKKK